MIKNRLNKKSKYALAFLSAIVAIILLLLLITPHKLFTTDYATVVESSEGKLLGARIADDQQWRFPPTKKVPEKYKKCLLQYEDRYFYWHWGINPISIARALAQNIKNRKVVSGGSTLTMQVCRMARSKKERSYKNKLIEMLWALSVEMRFSKNEILNLYASHAPFGGNIVGIDAAAWRYFNRNSNNLSWAETATLAVLPNAPALIYPGRSDKKLKQKRDKLLRRLLKKEIIDSLTYSLSILEPLPQKVSTLPINAYHLVEKAAAEKKGERVQSTISYSLQQRMVALAKRHHKQLAYNHINNLAILVSNINTKSVEAYVGNIFDGIHNQHNNHVDIIQSPRSTGSIIKPFLYCQMLDEGLITPTQLIFDIPIRFGGFTPMNFDREYSGAVPANQALARSLNIPAVNMLKEFGIAPFYQFLQQSGMTTLSHAPDYYGLSLILGGAEVTLWDLASMYTSLSAVLKDYNRNDGTYYTQSFTPLNWIATEKRKRKTATQPVVRASAIYSTFDALKQVKRPNSETGWEAFASSRNIAWKTGTSFGFRDAWAVGISGNYVVAVWVGNADGEGRSNMTGVTAAAPILFDVFSSLPQSKWFDEPTDEMESIELCSKSGYRFNNKCEEKVVVKVPKGIKTETCPWHQTINLNAEKNARVNSSCYPIEKMQHQNWFLLPPAIEFYYKKEHPLYQMLPPMHNNCKDEVAVMEFVYPREWARFFIPIQLDGSTGKVIVQLAHRNSAAIVYWHLDTQFLGSTENNHQMAIAAQQGWHTLSAIDQAGNQLKKRFFVSNKGD